MIEVNGSIDALLNSPEMFYEVANDLAASLSKSMADDDARIATVTKTLFDVVCSLLSCTYISQLLIFYTPESRRIRSQF